MKKTMRIAALFLCAVMMTCLMVGCDETTRAKEENYTEEIKTQIREIYELRDNPNLICYWYTKNDMSGKWVYQGTCVGYGIPYGASITNPEQYEYNGATLPLAEPNGIYTNGLSTSATWILTTDSSSKIIPTYVESEITISQSKIEARLCEDWSIPSDY